MRMNKRQHDMMYPKIVEKQKGEYCIMCGKDPYILQSLGQSPKLVIDCIPNDGDHTNPAKLQLLCYSCNTKKNHWRLEPEERRATPEMIKGRKDEKDFRRWVLGHFLSDENTALSYDYLLGSGAEKVGCSTETIKRYLLKMASSEGMYDWSDKFGSTCLVLKKDYKASTPTYEDRDPTISTQ
jgi:hypothetical protein